MADRTIELIPAKPVAAPTLDRPFRVAAYCRVSNSSEVQESNLNTQIQYYTTQIENHEFCKNAGVFADTATGRNMKKRVDFKKLLVK